MSQTIRLICGLHSVREHEQIIDSFEEKPFSVTRVFMFGINGEIKKRSAKRWFTIPLTIVFISCSWGTRQARLGEQFAMRPNDKVTVAGTGLTIRLEGVGHQTFSGPDPAPGAAAYVELLVSSESGSRSMRISVGESTEADEYFIKVNSAYPFRSQGGPRCELTVTKR